MEIWENDVFFYQIEIIVGRNKVMVQFSFFGLNFFGYQIVFLGIILSKLFNYVVFQFFKMGIVIEFILQGCCEDSELVKWKMFILYYKVKNKYLVDVNYYMIVIVYSYLFEIFGISCFKF